MKKLIITIIILVLLTITLMIGCDSQSLPKEPPELSITIGDKEIEYIIGKNKWDGAIYDREDTFQAILKEGSGINIPNIDIGEIATIKFKDHPPNKLTVYDVLIDKSGNEIYPQTSTLNIPVELKNGKFSIEINEHIASYLSSSYEEEQVNYRGFRMIASWGENECEYGFIIRTTIKRSGQGIIDR